MDKKYRILLYVNCALRNICLLNGISYELNDLELNQLKKLEYSPGFKIFANKNIKETKVKDDIPRLISDLLDFRHKLFHPEQRFRLKSINKMSYKQWFKNIKIVSTFLFKDEFENFAKSVGNKKINKKLINKKYDLCTHKTTLKHVNSNFYFGDSDLHYKKSIIRNFSLYNPKFKIEVNTDDNQVSYQFNNETKYIISLDNFTVQVFKLKPQFLTQLNDSDNVIYLNYVEYQEKIKMYYSREKRKILKWIYVIMENINKKYIKNNLKEFNITLSEFYKIRNSYFHFTYLFSDESKQLSQLLFLISNYKSKVLDLAETCNRITEGINIQDIKNNIIKKLK